MGTPDSRTVLLAVGTLVLGLVLGITAGPESAAVPTVGGFAASTAFTAAALFRAVTTFFDG